MGDFEDAENPVFFSFLPHNMQRCLLEKFHRKWGNIHRNHVKQKTGLKENINNKTTVRTLLGDQVLIAMQRCLN